MSKKVKNKKKDNRYTNNKRREFRIPEDVRQMSKLTIKRFKKENDFYDSKKDLRKAYYAFVIDLLPESIVFVIRYGHFESNAEAKEAIYSKITDPKFIKTLTKYIKDGNEVENLDLLPNVIANIINDAMRHQAEQKRLGEEVEFDLSDLTALSKLILKKRIKKLKSKAKIDEDLAFDLLSVIPAAKILDRSPYHHIRLMFTTIYEHGKTKDIDFGKVIKFLIKDKYIPGLVTFALLERKDKVSSFTDKQRALYNEITEFCFNTMEDMDKETIRMILNQYIQARQRDENQGRDSNRRYYISSLPSSDYPKIMKAVNKLIREKEENKKYL